MKKLVCLIMCCLLIFSIAACGNTTSEKSPATSESAAPAASSASTQKDTETSDITLEFWDMPWGGTAYQEEVKSILASYTDKTGIKFNYTSLSWDKWLQVFMTAVASGTAPDFSTGGSLLGHRLALTNDAYNMADFAKENFEDDFFVAEAVNTFYSGDTLVGVPWNMDLRSIYYRKDMFKDAGITKLPTTWDEFYDTCKQLTHDSQYGYVTSGSDNMAYWEYMFWSVNNGGHFLNKDMKSEMLNDANIKVADFLRKLYKDGLMPEGTPGYTKSDSKTAFLSGTSSMVMAGPSFLAEIKKAELTDVVGILPTMTSPSGVAQSVGSFNAIFVYADSEYTKESLDFISWYLRNNSTLWSKGGMGSLPAVKNTLSDKYFSDSILHKELIDNIIPKTVIQAYPFKSYSIEMDLMDSEQYYTDVLQAVYVTDKDAKAILKEADDNYNTALGELKSE